MRLTAAHHSRSSLVNVTFTVKNVTRVRVRVRGADSKVLGETSYRPTVQGPQRVKVKIKPPKRITKKTRWRVTVDVSRGSRKASQFVTLRP